MLKKDNMNRNMFSPVKNPYVKPKLFHRSRTRNLGETTNSKPLNLQFSQTSRKKFAQTSLQNYYFTSPTKNLQTPDPKQVFAVSASVLLKFM